MVPFSNIPSELNEKQIIFNEITKAAIGIANFLVLAVKFHVYKARCAGVKPNTNTNSYKSDIYFYRNAEKQCS